MSKDQISNIDNILKSFGFDIAEEEKKSNIPEYVILEIKNNKRYTFKTLPLMKISDLINGMFENKSDIHIPEDNLVSVPDLLDEKFMEFLLDYVTYVENNGLPIFNKDKIIAATVIENAIGIKLYELFVKHFKYKFQRSDLAVKQYLSIFGHMLECSTAIISNSLIEIFVIAHKIIIQHLPSSEFIIIDE